MEVVRDAWTDERMDDLNHRVDEGFNEVSREFRAVRLEVRTEFAAVRSEMKTEFAAVRSEMKGEFAAVRSEIAAFQRMFVQLFGGLMTTLLVGFASLIATILTRT
jgi:chromosome segregation ATPase